MPYMNVTEVESALIALASAHPSICELITLPNASIEGRVSHALRLGATPARSVPALYLTGGVHAREWGSCEILVNLATDLCDAYAGGTSLGYGNKTYSAAQVRVLMEQMNVIVFPCVNPDGRAFSQSTTPMWRKNRNPASSGGNANAIGVDINRNQDFLWNFTQAFAPAAVNVFLASESPTEDTFHGTHASSEPETRNVNFIHDNFAPIGWYVDVHSFSESILYAWGDDESQTVDTAQSFTNPAFDHQRGVIGGSYAEFIPDADQSAISTLAQSFTTSLAQVRGKFYVAKPSFSLYPTSGTNGDYAHSRAYMDASRPKTLGFTVEWGTEFQPPWAEMERIIGDVCSGFIGMGLQALRVGSFIVSNRDSFSSFEVETIADFPASFYVIYDGFSPNALGGVPAVDFIDATGTVIASMSATVASTQLENPGDLNAVQRITYTVDVHFTNASAFTVETRDLLVRARLAGMQDVAVVRLLRQPNPYMLDGPVSWLSTDVRTFQLEPGHHVDASAVNLGDANGNPDAPLQFIQAFLAELRSHGNAAAQAFENLPQQGDAARLELSRTVGGKRVMNFAVAKVRYRATTQDALDVRVFFRMFNVMVSDLSYDTRASSNVQNYRRSFDGRTPLLGINKFFSGAGSQITSIPFFASARINSATQSMTTQTDPTNVLTLVHAGATEAIAYFGCWLDFNQTEPQFPVAYPNTDGPFSNRVSILQLVRGLHQCLVAEIRFQPGAADPIPIGATPSSSSRLAQRNLAIVESDNPGVADAHRVQHTLLIKPSVLATPSLANNAGGNLAGAAGQAMGKAASAPAQVSGMPDELVLRFGELPTDTVASLYFPDFSADDILALERSGRPGRQRLTRVDAHTVSCRADGILYVPIPARANPVAAGLLTLQLPTTVRSGQVFHVDVQQHSGQWQASRGVPGTPDIPGPTEGPTVNDRRSLTPAHLSRRKVLGAFRLTTLVKQGPALLQRAVRDLALLKYIRPAIPPADSWAPVFDRYIAQLGVQVGALGGDPDAVPASADDPADGAAPGDKDRVCRTGKVSEVHFDCFGDFQGFTLRHCGGAHRYAACERAIADLVLKACQGRWDLKVCSDMHSGAIVEITVACC